MSILYAKQVPKTGGDTLWANLYAVYDALPDHMKTLLQGKSAIHDIGTFRNDFLGPEMNVKALTKPYSTRARPCTRSSKRIL